MWKNIPGLFEEYKDLYIKNASFLRTFSVLKCCVENGVQKIANYKENEKMNYQTKLDCVNYRLSNSGNPLD